MSQGKKSELTSEHREWLLTNYAHMSNRQCCKYIGCGYERLKRFVGECGLVWQSDRARHESKPKQEPKLIYLDKNAPGGYCMDCKRYKGEGRCDKTGKDVGALWKKKCFVK